MMRLLVGTLIVGAIAALGTMMPRLDVLPFGDFRPHVQISVSVSF